MYYDRPPNDFAMHYDAYFGPDTGEQMVRGEILEEIGMPLGPNRGTKIYDVLWKPQNF